MGIPLLMLAFGEAGMLPAIITTILNGAVIMAFGIVLLELDVHQGKGGLVALTNALRGVLRSPLVLSAAAGLLVSGLGIPLPNAVGTFCDLLGASRSEEHTSELQSLMRISYAVFCLKK